jgi:hypothetical protein
MGLHWTLDNYMASFYILLTFQLIMIGFQQEMVIFHTTVGEKLRQANNN